MPITDAEANQVTWGATQLRSGTEYRNAGRLIRQASPQELGDVRPRTDLYAAVRLQIGTWDQIAKWASNLTHPQKAEFFKTQPAKYMWEHLKPAVTKIRRDELGPNYARDFEILADESVGDDGKFKSAGEQAIVTMFC